MHSMGKKISELHAMLIYYEKGVPKKPVEPQLLAIQGGRIQKPNKPQTNKGKGKCKGKGKQVVAYQPKPKKYPSGKKDHPRKDQACHHCNKVLEL